MFRRLIILLGLCLMAGQSSAQDVRDMVVLRSRTGQFTVHSVRESNRPERPPLTAQISVAGTWGFVLSSTLSAKTGLEETIQLDPNLLIVACERLKEMLLREINQTDQWHGRINIIINSAMDENELPWLTAEYRPEGWSYELVFPKNISPRQLVRSLTHSLLLEIANRQAGKDSADLPFWLVEGMAANVQANNLPTYVIEPKAETFGNRIKLDGLGPVRTLLRTQAPLTFNELSWPDAEKLAVPEERNFYRSCAQLFVFALLHEKDGGACLTQTLQLLGKHANWQIAFLEGFHSHFAQLRDVEKWWGLTCVNFTGRDLSTELTGEDGLKKLQQALTVPAQIHLDPDRLPTEAQLTLQEAIRQLDDEAQLTAVQYTLQSLADLRPRVTKELAGLINKYESALQGYLRQRQAVRPALASKSSPSRLASARDGICQQLTRLDQERDALRLRAAPTRHEAETAALEKTMKPTTRDRFAAPKSR